MFDYVLQGGLVADGTGQSSFQGDVCIQDGKIAAVLPHFQGECRRVLDVTGKIVSPGFIDIHTHSDTIPLLSDMNPESKLFQGVTLEITGNCGISHLPAPPQRREELARFYNAALPASVAHADLEDPDLEHYAARVAQHPPAIHYGVLIGHGTLRGAVMGFDMRPPTPKEQAEMERLLDRMLEQGAFGMSLGLIYPPSSFADREELVGLARVLAARDRILSVHMRSESTGLFDAVEEMLEVARRSGVHLEISHLKLMGRPQWGRSGALLDRLEHARQAGIRVTCDQYPYTAGSTGLSALAPGWAHDGGVTQLVRRAQNPSQRLLEDIRRELERRGGPEAVLVVDTHGALPECDGRTLSEIAQERDLSPERAAADCLAQCGGSVSCIYFTMDPDDVCRIMRDPHISVGSDGVSYEYAAAAHHRFHPRNFSTFPRFLQTVREKQLLPLETAVYKMTGLPASVLGLRDRGWIKAGMQADLTVFTWEQVEDRSTYLKPAVKPQGIDYVFVGGELALERGVQTAARRGRVLLRGKE